MRRHNKLHGSTVWLIDHISMLRSPSRVHGRPGVMQPSRTRLKAEVFVREAKVEDSMRIWALAGT